MTSRDWVIACLKLLDGSHFVFDWSLHQSKFHIWDSNYNLDSWLNCSLLAQSQIQDWSADLTRVVTKILKPKSRLFWRNQFGHPFSRLETTHTPRLVFSKHLHHPTSEFWILLPFSGFSTKTFRVASLFLDSPTKTFWIASLFLDSPPKLSESAPFWTSVIYSMGFKTSQQCANVACFTICSIKAGSNLSGYAWTCNLDRTMTWGHNTVTLTSTNQACLPGYFPIVLKWKGPFSLLHCQNTGYGRNIFHSTTGDCCLSCVFLSLVS